MLCIVYCWCVLCLVVGCCVLCVANCLLFIVYGLTFVVRCSVLFVVYLLFVLCCSSFVVVRFFCLMFVVRVVVCCLCCCLLFVGGVCGLLFGVWSQTFVVGCCLLFFVCCLLMVCGLSIVVFCSLFHAPWFVSRVVVVYCWLCVVGCVVRVGC